MENPNFFPSTPRHKRKCDDSDAVLELLNGVSLSPRSKRMRQEFGSTSHCNEFVSNFASVPTPEVDFSDQPSSEMLLAPPDVDVSEHLVEPLPSAPLNNERAIVLYKPVNPPLFPGGPSAGSQVFLNARMLQTGVLDASNLLRNRKVEDLPWLQAPKSGVTIVDLSEEEASQPHVVLDNHLALIPWESNSTVNMLASQRAVQPCNVGIDGMSVDDATSGVEAMEEDNELSASFVNPQLSNSSSSFCYEPWQQYGPPQPQHSSVMWSH
ncbi:hypothetical protein GOP47_0008623 [Adiantum capillus-veneris]|uniref:Uncharacterized protein n=1 Tax=Adiantum capillus-veneris TaxID=13818 RepID=A0A9D4UYY4_ADICA|nr:hypothetical protein GOP47_0008623 [Adiantum capillus-veneris]